MTRDDVSGSTASPGSTVSSGDATPTAAALPSPGEDAAVARLGLPPAVEELLRLAQEVSVYGVRRRLGTLLHTPLTVQQLRCLTILVLEGSAAPAQVSALLEVSPATMTGIADRLERAGMIVRRTDDRDHRGRTLSPTTAGQAVVRQLMASDVAADADLLVGLSSEELAGLELGLTGMLRQLRATDRTGP
jgi:DNA-binding MarR family transcriptional regulator